jgi:hypothetical protein
VKATLIDTSEQHDAVLVAVDSEFLSVFRQHGRSLIPGILPEESGKARLRR